MDVKELEKIDNVVDALGLDKDRAIYFKNSRLLLSSEDQSNAIEHYENTNWRLNLTAPSNVACLKSLTIHRAGEDKLDET